MLRLFLYKEVNKIVVKLIPYNIEYLELIVDLNEKSTKAIGAFFGPAMNIDDLLDIDNYYINNNSNFILAIDEKNNLLGMGAYYKIDDMTVEIKRMRVSTDHQGHGIGKKVLRFLMSDAIDKGYRRFILETTIRQLVAIKFYESFGFRKFAEESIEGVICYWLEYTQSK